MIFVHGILSDGEKCWSNSNGTYWPDLLSASIWVSNARQLFLEFQTAEVLFHQTLRSEPWHGAGEGRFIVADPDGNLISFGGRAD